MRYTDPGGGIGKKTGKLASCRRRTSVARSTQYGGGAMLRSLAGWPPDVWLPNRSPISSRGRLVFAAPL